MKRVVIDKIQRLPSLLNEVHRLIETQGVHFLQILPYGEFLSALWAGEYE